VASSNAGNLEYGGCLWSIDSDWDCRGVSPGEIYSITDHCGQVEILQPDIDPHFLARQILSVGTDMGFNRDYRPSLTVMEYLNIELPVKPDGSFDLEFMQRSAGFFEKVEELTANIEGIGFDDEEPIDK